MATMDFDTIFERAPGANLVLSLDLNIVAVSDDYLTATMTQRDGIVDRHLFEVFPDNPDDPTADGVRNLRASLQRVVANGKTDGMAIQRYDIRAPQPEGRAFKEHYWSPINSPVFDRAGQLRYIVHHVEDVTALEHAKRRLRAVAEVSTRKEQLAGLLGIVRSLAVEALDPLAVIETSAYLCSRNHKDPRSVAKHVERIGRQVPAASQIMGKIAEVAREQLLPGDDVSVSIEIGRILEELDRATDSPSSRVRN
jgi:hypothetical protein